MAINDIKKAVNYSLYLIGIIVALTWIDNYYNFFPWLQKFHPDDDATLFPVLISVLAVMVVFIIYQHNNSMTKGLHLSAYVAHSTPHTRRKIDYLLENFQESIMVLYLNGGIVYCNKQAREIFSLSPNANIFQEDGFPIQAQKIQTIKNSLREGHIWEDKSVIRMNGQKRTFMHRIYPLSIKSDPAQVVVISTDITELAEARKNAENANLSKSQFLANMTHELRTPMIGILGSSDLLDNTGLSSEQHLHLDTIKECGEQLLNTINDILDLSKIDLGMDTLKPSAVDLRLLLKKTTDMLATNLQAKGLALNLYVDPAFPPLLLLDELKLRQVMVNLLLNAIKFTPSGSIEVKAMMDIGRDSDWLVFSVEDTGIGIPADKLDIIFNSFTQADSSSCREFGGTGLGLYICKRLISLMSGDIWVNTEEGKGTTFAFRIPLAEAILEEDMGQINSNSNPGRVEEDLINSFIPISILVVEDNELNQKLIIQMLMSYGFEVEYVNNGLECLNILQQRSFDLILMDMQMPVMDGYEATRFIRANKSWRQIPVIAITANALSGDREKCLECGCSSYLAKPFKAFELVQEIKIQLKTKFVHKTSNDPLSNQLIAELIPEFMETLAEMLDELQESINKRDMKQIQHISHAIKGTAGMYGFIQISEIAALIEQACRENQSAKIPRLYTQIYKSYQQINTRLCAEIVG